MGGREGATHPHGQLRPTLRSKMIDGCNAGRPKVELASEREEEDLIKGEINAGGGLVY